MRSNKIFKNSLLLFVRLIAMTLVCFLSSTFILMSSTTQLIRAFVQVACIIVTMGVIYPTLHNLGGMDRNLVDAGVQKPNMHKGLIIGLIGNSPFIASGIALIINKIYFFSDKYYGIYKLINSIYYSLNSSIMPNDDTILTVKWSAVIISASMILLMSIVCMFAYILGYYRFLFKENVFYKEKA